MILKYKVPEQFKNYFKTNTLYCKIKNTINGDEKFPTIYLVEMLNFKNKTNTFSKNELQKCNLLDRIKLLKYIGGKR